MSRHDEVLTELGLAPTWQRRARPGLTRGPDARVAPVPPPVASGVAASASPEARIVRIAALEWRDFAADVDSCVACGLSRTRKKTVPGVGDVHAEWLFIGEAPGAEEDAKGEPFVGQAGKLLDNMLAALGMNRGKSVYIANVLKCRPPGNRNPEPDEVATCRPFLFRQIDVVQPKVMVALGTFAAQALLDTKDPISRLRGRAWPCRDRLLVPTFHPAFLLRSPDRKRDTWDDMKLVMSILRGEREN